MSDERFASIEQAVRRVSDRLEMLESHGLPLRVATLEAGLLRVERQLDLVFAQGQSNSKALGDQRVILERVEVLLAQLVYQQTPSVIRG